MRSIRPSLLCSQLVMNSWEKDACRQRQRAELGVDTKRKGEPTSTIPIKRTRADAPSISDKATIGEHCQGCGRPRHTRDECRSRDIPGWNVEGRWIDSKAYKAANAINTWHSIQRTTWHSDPQSRLVLSLLRYLM